MAEKSRPVATENGSWEEVGLRTEHPQPSKSKGLLKTYDIKRSGGAGKVIDYF